MCVTFSPPFFSNIQTQVFLSLGFKRAVFVSTILSQS
uniref:Uncharacterized protein n=1 Tax=Anguilla anguilla TaxID=7936 RepID=A0A0E9QJY8_ANGAN